MKHTYTKKEVLRIIIATAKEYAKMLEGLNYLFIYCNRISNEIEYFEAVFLPRNYQHLTGVEFLDMEGNLLKRSDKTLYGWLKRWRPIFEEFRIRWIICNSELVRF